MVEKAKKVLINYKYYILTLIIVFAFSLTFPFSGDDWRWKLVHLSIDAIEEFSQSTAYNGRYLGNILITIISKNAILRGVFVSFTLTTIVELISRKLNIKRTFLWCMLLTLSLKIIRESIVWASGFTNYTISTLFFLLDILYIEKIYNQKNSKWYYLILSFVLFYASCLFIENVTIFLLGATFILNIIYFKKYKKINLGLLVPFIGTLLGTLTMFIHPAYLGVLNGTDGYRTMSFGLIKIVYRICANLCTTIHKFIVFDNPLLITLISLFTYIYYKKLFNRRTKKTKKYLDISFCFQFMLIAYIWLCKLNPSFNTTFKYISILNAILSLIYFTVLTINIYVLYKDNKDKLLPKMLVPIISIIGLTLPLLIVTPIGARNFFLTSVLEIILLCYIYKSIEILLEPQMSKIPNMLLVILVTYYLSIYGYIRYIDIKRHDYIMESIDKNITYITVPALPFEDYVWHGDFDNVYHDTLYKELYNIDKSVTFNFVTLEEWKTKENPEQEEN